MTGPDFSHGRKMTMRRKSTDPEVSPMGEKPSPLGREIIEGLQQFKDYLEGSTDAKFTVRTVERQADGSHVWRDEDGNEIGRKES